MLAERVPRGWTGLEVAHYPLEDNAADKLDGKPFVRGMAITGRTAEDPTPSVFAVVREVAQRIYDKRPTVVLSHMGLNRAPLVAGCALRLCGETPQKRASDGARRSRSASARGKRQLPRHGDGGPEDLNDEQAQAHAHPRTAPW